jgi:hypothetical protein
MNLFSTPPTALATWSESPPEEKPSGEIHLDRWATPIMNRTSAATAAMAPAFTTTRRGQLKDAFNSFALGRVAGDGSATGFVTVDSLDDSEDRDCEAIGSVFTSLGGMRFFMMDAFDQSVRFTDAQKSQQCW